MASLNQLRKKLVPASNVGTYKLFSCDLASMIYTGCNRDVERMWGKKEKAVKRWSTFLKPRAKVTVLCYVHCTALPQFLVACDGRTGQVHLTDSFGHLTMLWVLCSRVVHKSDITSLQLGEHGKQLYHAEASFKTWRKDLWDRPLSSVCLPAHDFLDEAWV